MIPSGPVEAGRVLTFSLDSRQHRLAVHAALACVQGCLADLENLSAVVHVAQIFQVSQQGSKKREQGRYRKTGGCAELRQPAGAHQAAQSADGESGCGTTGGANGREGELSCHRPPSLCPPAHHSPSRARRVCQELRCQAKSTRYRLELLGKAARAQGLACAARQGSAQAAARLGEPSRVAACGALAGAVMHGSALGRAGARPACPSRSPYAQPLCPGWADLGTALGRYMHSCAAGRVQNVKSSKSVPPTAGPDRQLRWASVDFSHGYVSGLESSLACCNAMH